MKSKLLLFLLFSLISGVLYAYTLDGTFVQNPNGSYSVTLHTPEGHVFNGYATYQDDQTFKIVVKDDRGVTFSGNAVANGDMYDMQLENAVTGEMAIGTLDEE